MKVNTMSNDVTLDTARFNEMLNEVLAKHNVKLSKKLDEDKAEELGEAVRQAALSNTFCARDKSYRGKLYAFSSSNNTVVDITDDNVDVYWDEDEQAFVLGSDGVIGYSDFTVAVLFQVGDMLAEKCDEYDYGITLRKAVKLIQDDE